MSEINYQALREAAEKATKGRWAVEFDDEIYSTDGVNHEQIAMVFSENEARDAAFIAAANPATVLALLDELETAEKRIAELEAKLDSADKLQDSAFRHGLQHGFSLGQTDNQAGFDLRDAGKPCISCGRLPEQKFGGTMDCGHYRTRGAAAHLAFNLHNTAAQCVYCNRDRDGAQKAFEQGLIERIGAEKVEAINNDNSVRRFDIPYLQRIKSIFTRKARTLEKRRARHQEAA